MVREFYAANECDIDEWFSEPLIRAYPTADDFFANGADRLRREQSRDDHGTNMDIERLLNTYKHAVAGSGKRHCCWEIPS